MDPLNNPYRPGAGVRPPLLAGRERELDAFDVLPQRCEQYGEGGRPWVLNGLRGVGKTVLLTEMFARTDERRWITARVEAGAGRPLPVLLAQAVYSALRTATGRHPASVLRRAVNAFKGFSVSVDPSGVYRFGVELDNNEPPTLANTGELSRDLTELFVALGEAARDRGVGALLLIDELQAAEPSELEALNVATHAIGQAPTPPPMLVVGAGLPSLPAVLADATSYAERLYEYRNIGLLDSAAAADALVVPAGRHDVEWSGEALEIALVAAAGYPYFIQTCGKLIWEHAARSPISAEDADVGTRLARAELDNGLYRSRWERATPSQRQLMVAMAEYGEDATIPVSELPAKVGKRRAQDISVARRELIRKGLIFDPERGMLRFTVPGMADFVSRQQP